MDRQIRPDHHRGDQGPRTRSAEAQKRTRVGQHGQSLKRLHGQKTPKATRAMRADSQAACTIKKRVETSKSPSKQDPRARAYISSCSPGFESNFALGRGTTAQLQGTRPTSYGQHDAHAEPPLFRRRCSIQARRVRADCTRGGKASKEARIPDRVESDATRPNVHVTASERAPADGAWERRRQCCPVGGALWDPRGGDLWMQLRRRTSERVGQLGACGAREIPRV